MSKYQPEKSERFFKRFFIISIAIVIAVFLIFMLGCSSSKKIESSSVITEEKNIIDSSSYWKLKFTDLKLLSEEHQKELKSQLEFQESNGEQLVEAFENVQDLFIEKGLLSDSLNTRLKVIFDSIKNHPCKSSLETKADGSIKATGLKSAQIDFSQWNNRLELMQAQTEEETNKRLYVEEQLKIEIANKKVDKKTKLFSQWWIWFILIIAGFVGGFWTCWKYKKKIENEINSQTNKK